MPSLLPEPAVLSESGEEQTRPSPVSVDTPDSVLWSLKEKAILNDSIHGYRSAKKNTKATFIVHEVIPKIKDAWDGRYSKRNMEKHRELKSEWAKQKKVRMTLARRTNTNVITQQIFNWFPNHAATQRKMKIPGFNNKITFDSVVAFRKKKEIEAAAKVASGDPDGTEGSRTWLKHYQGAKKEIKENLTELECEAYNAEVAEWKKSGVPMEVQIG